MAAKGVELASAYISLSVSTDDIPEQVEEAFGKAAKPAEKAGREAGERFSRGANSTLGKGISQSLAKELGAAGDKGSRELLRSLASGHRQAERDVQIAGRRYADALKRSMSGGSRDAAVKWEAEFKRALSARDSSKVYFDEFERVSSARGAKVGHAVGTVVGKSIGTAISLGVTAAAALATTAVGGLTYSLFKGFERYKSLDATNRRLRSMGKSGAQVKSIMDDINSVVEGTPISLDAAAESATQFLAGNIKEGEELKEVLTSIADAAGFSGQSFEDLSLIFGQVMNKGKLQAEEMLQLNERNIPIQQWLQKELGVTGQELQKLSEDGQISFANLVDAVESNAPGMAKALGDTIDGALSNMKSAASRIGANIFAVIFGDPLSTDDGPGGMAKAIGKVTDRLREVNAWVVDNGDVLVEWIANTAKGMTYLGETITVILAGTTRGLAVFVNAFGDTLGAMTRGIAAVNRILGRTEIADELDALADSQFGWADGLNKTEDEMYDLAKSIGGLRGDIDDWKNSTADAARFTKDLGTAAAKIAPANWWGTTIIKSPTADEIEKIKQAGYEVKAIPGTKDVEIVPVTEEATKEMDAWRDKQGRQPAVVPIEADTVAAEDHMNFFRQEMSKPLVIGVDILPGQIPNLPPGTITPDDLGGLLGAGGNAPAPGPGPLPSGVSGGGGIPGGPTAGFPNATPGSSGRLFGTAGNSQVGLTTASVDAIAQRFGLTKTSGLRPGDGGYHGSGQAGDYSGSPQQMQAFAAYMSRTFGSGLLELIFDAPGWAGNVKNGAITGAFGNVYTMDQAGYHGDHVHVAVKGYNSGGGVNGPGTGTSDSIPAWLSNGEHVLTAKDVAAMGGQAGVYAFRSAIHRDKGGAIDWRLPGESKRGNNTKGNFNPNMKIDLSTTTWRGEDGVTGMMRRLLPEDLPGWKLGQTPYGYLAGFESGDVEFAQWASMVMGKNRGWMSSLKVAQKPGAWPPRAYAAGGAVGAAAQGMATNWDEEQWKQILAQNPGATPAQIAQQAMGTPHAGSGAAPGPRTEGYIPATAGNTAPVGQGGLSNFLDLGESAIHNLIDTGAQLGSMAVSAAAAAGSFGAGAAAGPAASAGIQMGAEAAKRAVSYGYDMAGIWGEALVEQIFPFGAPRWLGSANPMAFMPQWGPQEGQKEPGTMGKAAESVQSWAQPGNPAMANMGTGSQGAQAALGAAKQQPSYQAAPPQGQTQAPPPVNPMDPSTWLQFGGVFDQGGILEPGSFGVNLSKQPEAVFTQRQLAEMGKVTATNSSGGDTNQFYAQDVEGMFREYLKSRRREARTYSGRP